MTSECLDIQNCQEIPFLPFLFYVGELRIATLIRVTVSSHVSLPPRSNCPPLDSWPFVTIPTLADSCLCQQAASSLKVSGRRDFISGGVPGVRSVRLAQ